MRRGTVCERMSNSDTGEKKILNKVIFVFFAHKKYSRSFIKLRLNHCCHMDYLTMSLLPFWALNVVVVLLSMQGQKLSDFIKNILICVSKMNEGLTGLERQEGE